MKDLEESTLGFERIEALVARDRIAHHLFCARCGLAERTEFLLAILGWTASEYLVEAFPEFYGG